MTLCWLRNYQSRIDLRKSQTIEIGLRLLGDAGIKSKFKTLVRFSSPTLKRSRLLFVDAPA